MSDQSVISVSPENVDRQASRPVSGSGDARPGAVRLEGLTKRYAGSLAVRSLDLDVAEGELLTLLGPSGCGKTTTLRCIAGLETPDEGRIRFGDTVIVDQGRRIDVPVHRRDIGMVFQSYALWPHMSVHANVAYPLRVAGAPKAQIRSRVTATLGLVGLADYGQRSVSALSGGQQQRVALARALVRSPRVLLLDEPLSNLDASLRAQMRIELRRIHEETGTTMVYVTHDQLEAATLSDRVVVMKDGRAVQMGTPAEIFTRPRSAWIAAFLGFDNLIDAAVTGVTAGGIEVRPHGWDRSLVCPPADGVTPGTDVSLAVRSTAIGLGSGERPQRANSFEARVLRRTYLGNLTELTVDAFGTELVACAPDSAVPAGREKVIVEIPAESIALVSANDAD